MKRYMAWQKEFVTLLTVAGFARHRQVLPMAGLVVLVEAYSATKKLHGTYKATKPDIDNIQKSLLDSLWGKHGLYANLADDNAVSHIQVIKVWSAQHRISFFQQTNHDSVRQELIAKVQELESSQHRSPVKPSRKRGGSSGIISTKVPQ